MDPRRQPLLIRDESQQPAQLFALLGLERRHDCLVVLARDPADLPERGPTLLGQMERVSSPVLRVLPALHESERLELVHDRDEAAFELHAGLSHTVRMVSRVEPLIDHPFEATRAEQIA